MNPLDGTKAELNGFYDAIYDNYGPGVPLSMEDSFRCIELHHKLVRLRLESILADIDSLRPAEIRARIQQALQDTRQV